MNTFKQLKQLKNKLDVEMKTISERFNKANNLDFAHEVFICINDHMDEMSVSINHQNKKDISFCIEIKNNKIVYRWNIKEEKRDFYNNLIADILEHDCFKLNDDNDVDKPSADEILKIVEEEEEKINITGANIRVNNKNWNKLSLITQYANLTNNEKTISYLINNFKDNHNRKSRLESDLYLAERENERLTKKLEALEKNYNEICEDIPFN